MITPYYEDENAVLFQGDNLEIMGEMEEESVDLIFADPPYFLSNDGFSCSGGKQVSVNKGEWDRDAGIEERHAFNRAWLAACRRVLTLNGTIFISGTYHNIYSIGMALENAEGIEQLRTIDSDGTERIYDLSGRLLSAPQKGINIINGKKIISK